MTPTLAVALALTPKLAPAVLQVAAQANADFEATRRRAWSSLEIMSERARHPSWEGHHQTAERSRRRVEVRTASSRARRGVANPERASLMISS